VVEDGGVEVVDVVEEIAGDGGVRGDGGGLEAEVVVVGDYFFVDVRFAGGDGYGDWQRQRDLAASGGFEGEHAAFEVVVGGGGDGGAVGGDEVDAGVVEVDGEVGVVGDDDADGQEAVGVVVEAGVRGGFFGVAGFDGDGEVVGCVGFVERILLRGERWSLLAGLLGGGGEGCRDDDDEG